MLKFKKHKLKIVIFLVLVAVAGGGWWLFGGGLSPIRHPELDSGSNKVDSGSPSFDEASLGANITDTNIYRDAEFSFSFKMPQGFEAQETIGEGGKIIIIKPTADGTADEVARNDKIQGFQILIIPFDEPDLKITAERVRADIPDMTLSNPQEITLDGASGLKFESDNEAFGGASFDVWFVKGYNLFQISTYKEGKDLVEKAIESWKFGLK